MNSKFEKTYLAHFFVAKGISKNPAKIIKFMIDNVNYFPGVNFDDLKKNLNVTDEDIEKEKTILLESLNSETVETPNRDVSLDEKLAKLKVNLKDEQFIAEVFEKKD